MGRVIDYTLQAKSGQYENVLNACIVFSDLFGEHNLSEDLIVVTDNAVTPSSSELPGVSHRRNLLVRVNWSSGLAGRLGHGRSIFLRNNENLSAWSQRWRRRRSRGRRVLVIPVVRGSRTQLHDTHAIGPWILRPRHGDGEKGCSAKRNGRALIDPGDVPSTLGLLCHTRSPTGYRLWLHCAPRRTDKGLDLQGGLGRQTAVLNFKSHCARLAGDSADPVEVDDRVRRCTGNKR